MFMIFFFFVFAILFKVFMMNAYFVNGKKHTAKTSFDKMSPLQRFFFNLGRGIKTRYIHTAMIKICIVSLYMTQRNLKVIRKQKWHKEQETFSRK